MNMETSVWRGNKMPRYIFEDDYCSPISKLLELIYDDCKFASGNGLLYKYLDEDKESIAVIDLIPDNLYTIKKYERIAAEYPGRVLIWPCAEFASIYMLAKLNIGKYKDIASEVNNYCVKGHVVSKYTDNTFEKYLKRVLNSQYLCTIDKTSNSNPFIGLFYTTDCLCSNPRSMCKFNDINSKCVYYKRFAVFEWNKDSIVALYYNICHALGIDIKQVIGSIVRY